jgi:NADH:ubiquinone oxidoreductase subunit
MMTGIIFAAALSLTPTAGWREPTAPIAPGWQCWIEHKTDYPNEKICLPPAFTRYYDRLHFGRN